MVIAEESSGVGEEWLLPEPPRPILRAPGPIGVSHSGDRLRHHGDRPEQSVEPFADVSRVSLLMLAAVAFSIAGQLIVVSGIQHRAAQQRAYDQLRKELAEGTAPLGPTDSSGRLLRIGRPVALIQIPSIGVRQVVLEGTTSGVLMSGPGHSRTSPLPGQGGTSVIFGRQASYGGVFGRLHQLRPGAKVMVTTGEGVSTFKVIDVRRAGDRSPIPLLFGHGRLLLVTANGARFVPSGVLRVDADLVTSTLPGAPSSAPRAGAAEQLMAGDTSTVWALVLWLEALIAVTIGVVWSWTRWGHRQTWIVFLPLTALTGLFTTGQFMKLLPNLL